MSKVEPNNEGNNKIKSYLQSSQALAKKPYGRHRWKEIQKSYTKTNPKVYFVLKPKLNLKYQLFYVVLSLKPNSWKFKCGIDITTDIAEFHS